MEPEARDSLLPAHGGRAAAGVGLDPRCAARLGRHVGELAQAVAAGGGREGGSWDGRAAEARGDEAPVVAREGQRRVAFVVLAGVPRADLGVPVVLLAPHLEPATASEQRGEGRARRSGWGGHSSSTSSSGGPHSRAVHARESLVPLKGRVRLKPVGPDDAAVLCREGAGSILRRPDTLCAYTARTGCIAGLAAVARVGKDDTQPAVD